MTRRSVIVAMLLRVYLRAWRREYGAELADILIARPVTPRVLADVAWNGLRQRVRAAEPSTLLGLASMLFLLGGVVLTPTNYDQRWTALLQPTSKTFPTVTVTFMLSEVYAILLVACGCWTHLRYGRTPGRAGVAAMKMSLIAGIPVTLGGLLMMFGLLDIATSPARSAVVYFPIPLVLTLAPLLRVPEAWIWGAIGGLLGRWIARSRQRAAA